MAWLSVSLIFWICGLLVVAVYIGYPAAIWAVSRMFAPIQSRAIEADHELPTLTLLIAAYNEEGVIEQRVRNALAMDYPSDRLEVIIGLDGCTDQSAEVLRSIQLPGVRVLEFEQRRGKASVLNELNSRATGEIVLLSDANTDVDPGAARKLVRWFQDLRVGVVVGRLILTDAKSGQNVDGLYWKYETFLKRCEGRIGALLGANGAIYAIRRRLFVPIAADTIIDDFVIPLLAKLRSGCAIVYDSDAVAREETAPSIASEFQRRARIGAGGFQSIATLWRLLDPRRGWIAFTFFSHKVLRWLCPFFLIGLLAGNAMLWRQSFFGVTLALQLLFYSTALAVGLLPRDFMVPRALRLITMFVSMNVALLVGFFRWIMKRQKPTWKRTTRIVGVNGVVH